MERRYSDKRNRIKALLRYLPGVRNGAPGPTRHAGRAPHIGLWCVEPRWRGRFV